MVLGLWWFCRIAELSRVLCPLFSFLTLPDKVHRWHLLELKGSDSSLILPEEEHHTEELKARLEKILEDDRLPVRRARG